MANNPQSITKKLFLIAGPCVIESYDIVYQVAQVCKNVSDELGLEYILKSSYRKANRSRLDSFQGRGDEESLAILQQVGKELNIPTITDIHAADEAAMAAAYVDYLQIPAFLARQTDLLIAAGQTGKPVNIKKGQFMGQMQCYMRQRR